MKKITASAAKQGFGELLSTAAREPVAIERHQKVRAVVCSPEAFAALSGADRALDERRAARAAQTLVEKDRLIRHQRMALRLLLAPRAQQKALLARAHAEVDRWQRERLCSEDHIQRWRALLGMPLRELADALSRDDLEEGVALRQNSPWHVLAP